MGFLRIIIIIMAITQQQKNKNRTGQGQGQGQENKNIGFVGNLETGVFEETDFLKDLKIDFDNFNLTVQLHPHLFWKYGKLARLASRELSRHQLHVDALAEKVKTVKAEVAEAIRERLINKNEKVTEKLVENLTLADRTYIAAVDELNEARQRQVELEFEASILALAEKIFSKRSDLLVMVGYSLRDEKKSDVSIYDQDSDYRMRAEAELREQEEQARRMVARRRDKKVI